MLNVSVPECFEIERRLKEELDIPVMHDDQHGTAIISSAGLLNALEVAGKKIEEVKIVVNGAGASATSCTKLYEALGARRENILMLDSKGVITSDRENLTEQKRYFATDRRDVHTLAEAIKGADVFLGLSKGNVLTQDMVRSMADHPIVFALANPTPEISYEDAMAARPDVLMSTGRSDYPNQINNVIGFPYIFRGALDTQAKAINEAMKIAAVHAIANLAKQPVPDVVNEAYHVNNFTFGPEYFIPNIIVLRCDEPLEEAIFKKISLFCNVKPDCVIENITLPYLYEAPLMLEKSNFSSVVCRELNIDAPEPDLDEWTELVHRIKNREKEVKIGLVGKYVQLHDAYLSVAEALRHAGYTLNTHIRIDWIDSENLTEANYEQELSHLDGIIVPGGFGGRGIEGMILAAKYARENNVPYFGICLGMQIAVIEYARDVAGIKDAHSGEFDELCKNKVIDFMPGQSDNIDKGGTLRLGAYPCVIKPGTTMERCYGKSEISERHRHRYEFNNDYRDILTQNGLTLSGLSPDGRLVETVELSDRPFYVGVQYHPEFKSRPNKAHPLFKGFIAAALEKSEIGE